MAGMTRVKEAREILGALGLPKAQQNVRSGLTLLALAAVGPKDDWSAAARPRLRTVDLMAYIHKAYGRRYKPNTRETFRRQTLHQFEQASVVERNPDDPGRPTNSGLNCYQLTSEAHAVLRVFGNDAAFARAAAGFGEKSGVLRERYAARRTAAGVPLRLPDGRTVVLSPGAHNDLQVAIIEKFGPRFVAGARVLYVGDTAKKSVVLEQAALAELQVPLNAHDKLPDVVLYDAARRWLFLIEAVTTHGPFSPKRQIEIEAALHACPLARVYVSAFRTLRDFKKYAGEIAWETEVWIAEVPDHMIHFNGDKFLGPARPAT